MTRAQALATLCDGLAAVFAAPLPAERIATLRSAHGAAVLAELGTATGLTREVAALAAALAAGPPVATAVAVEQAHVRLFSGAAGPGTLAPYESVHASAAVLLFQRPAAAMQALLAQLDLDVAGLPAEPPDHIAVQLAVLAEVLRRNDARTALTLLDDHLLRWAPGFAAQCRAHDPHGLHAAAAALLSPLLAQTRDHALATAGAASMKEDVT